MRWSVGQIIRLPGDADLCRTYAIKLHRDNVDAKHRRDFLKNRRREQVTVGVHCEGVAPHIIANSRGNEVLRHTPGRKIIGYGPSRPPYCLRSAVILRFLGKTNEKAIKFDYMRTGGDNKRTVHYQRRDFDRSNASKNCRKPIRKLRKEKERLLVFVKNPDVDVTSNETERALGHGIIASEIIGGSRSVENAKTHRRLTNGFQSFKLRGENLLH